MPTIHLNGQEREVTSHPDMPLLWVIRDEFGCTGPKYGCGHGVCGGCVSDVDGAQVHLCKNTVADVQGKKITTIEGQKGPIADAVFDAWIKLDVAQCGMCQPAQINSTIILLKRNPNPTDADIDEAMKHNLCRCATYARIRKLFTRQQQHSDRQTNYKPEKIKQHGRSKKSAPTETQIGAANNLYISGRGTPAGIH